MKITKQKNNPKVNSSYLNRLKLHKTTYKKIPIYGINKAIANVVRVYENGKLVDEFTEQV